MLEGELKAAAEAFFAMELSDVGIHFSPLPAAFGAVAFAYGDDIYLDAEPTASLSHRCREALGHELTHVIQQRQGRVPATLMLHGLPANQDPVLEREAEEMGRRFARGEPSILPRLPLSHSHPPVMQRLLSFGGKLYGGPPPLSAKAGIILDLVQGGMDWLNWVGSLSTAQYGFADESQLLAGIQSGIHGTPVILLRKSDALVHASRLRELSEAELTAILTAENSGTENTITNARKALAANGLLTQQDLDSSQTYLQGLGAGPDQPVFQAMTLSDRIALHNLVDGMSISLGQMLQKEASAFALSFAHTPQEFADYCRFYISTVEAPNPKPGDAGKRSRFAETTAEVLTPLLYNLLWCPSIAGAPSAQHISEMMQNWMDTGNVMGFPRLSSALYHINQHARLQGASGQHAQSIISQFMARIQNELMQQPPTHRTMSQDGTEYHYHCPSSSLVRELALSEDGNFTLRNLRAPKQS